MPDAAPQTATQFDVLVVGGGHAGAEAAHAAARLGARTALLTFQRAAIGRMSCNPAIGGIGKGQMVREIDALGGLMGLVADETGIQFRMLNRRKGPAVWAPRCQSDSDEYPRALQRRLAETPNLTIIEAAVDELLTEPHDAPAGAAAHRITGLRLSDGRELRAPVVIITSGTFLGGLMHCGEQKTAGGRVGEPAARTLSDSLRALGLRLERLKTGTPPRVRRASVDLTACERQPGDAQPVPFSFMHDTIETHQVDCWITYTDPAIHDLIRANLHRAPMFSGQIESRGPRYCPSIEDKVVRFADKERHQIFVEPEGRNSERLYLNGISTSLPREVQERMVRSLVGFERAEIVQWGYAVEYDFVPPEQVDATLMTKRVAGLFLAGQINGTSGYEEAAGQGLLAGVNAVRWLGGHSPMILRRDQAYIGVMVDDLVTAELLEPYRMFTSRAEHRMHLRYDNADERLTPLGRELGLVDGGRFERFEQRQVKIRELRSTLEQTRHGGTPLAVLLKRTQDDGEELLEVVPALRRWAAEPAVWRRVLVDIRYEGYLARQERLMAQQASFESQPLPKDFNYSNVPNLRVEARERLTAVRPRTLGQASRVSGVRPTDITVLLMALRSASSPDAVVA